MPEFQKGYIAGLQAAKQLVQACRPNRPSGLSVMGMAFDHASDMVREQFTEAISELVEVAQLARLKALSDSNTPA